MSIRQRIRNAHQQAFFPVPPPADLSDIQTINHDMMTINHDTTAINQEPIYFPEIIYQEITQVIKSLPPNKVPGEDSLPNSLWHKLIEILVVLATISQIYNAYVRIGTNPSYF